MGLIGSFVCLCFSFESVAEPVPMPRQVICLYQDQATHDLQHRGVEVVLNHMGFIADLRDVEAVLPRGDQLEDVHGVIVWLSASTHSTPDQFLEWLTTIVRMGKKLVLLDTLPPISNHERPLAKNQAREMLELLGLEFKGRTSRDVRSRETLVLDPATVGFERPYQDPFAELPGLRSKSPEHRVHLALRDKISGVRSDLVLSAPWGGIALQPALYSINPVNFQKQWILNPFKFLEHCLAPGERPIPDVTTLNGSRTIYCHIDGDAFSGICMFDQKKYCGEYLYENILKKFPYPHTLSLVYSWFDPEVSKVKMYYVAKDKSLVTSEIKIDPAERQLWIKQAREIFSQPWVEPALHGYGHPLYWKKKILAIYAQGKDFNLNDEFDLSLKIMNTLIPQDKPVRLFLWTGDCAPTLEQLAHLDNLGLMNLNGGDPILDPAHDSHFNLAPLTRRVGDQLQVYSSGSNENIYTNLWTGPFYGFRNVIQTFERTEEPRRLSPVNIYYHWYSAERKASLQAVDDVYSWARRQQLTPIWATRHVENVHGFLSCRIARDGEDWLISNNGRLRTLRLDRDDRIPEVSRDNNILGYHIDKGRTYIHLGPGPSTRLRWNESPSSAERLTQADCVVEDVFFEESRVGLQLWGFGNAHLRFDDLRGELLPSGQVKISRENGATDMSLVLNGHLELWIPRNSAP